MNNQSTYSKTSLDLEKNVNCDGIDKEEIHEIHEYNISFRIFTTELCALRIANGLGARVYIPSKTTVGVMSTSINNLAMNMKQDESMYDDEKIREFMMSFNVFATKVNGLKVACGLGAQLKRVERIKKYESIVNTHYC